MDSRKLYIGWCQALFSVLVLWGVSNVFMSYSTQILGVNKIVFACATYTSCSLLLLLYAGRGTLSKETLRSVDTWAYGLIMLCNYFVTLNLYATISATEASLVQRFSVIASLLFSWFFLHRTPTRGQLVGATILAGGLIVVASDLPNEIAMQVYGLIVLAAIFQASRIFVAELHRPHKQAAQQDVKSRCRVVGYVMFIITILFVAMVGLFTFLQASVPVENRLFPIAPEDFIHAPSIIMGMIMGVVIYTPLRYLEFASSHVIKTENFLAVTALSFFSTFFWEWATLPITGLSLSDLSTTDIIAGTVVTGGALLMSVSKIYSTQRANPLEEYIRYCGQDIEQVEDSREIVASTLEHFNGDLKKSARTLEVPLAVIEAFLNDREKVLAFRTPMLKTVARHYRKKVANSDALTGLVNRTGFMTAMKGAAHEFKTFSVVFIDLNKFKPINDTYGHDAGDFVLKTIGNRLVDLFGKHAEVTRLGGDEFCILLFNKTKKQAIATLPQIQSAIDAEMTFEGSTFAVSASLGVANYPKDSDSLEGLLKLADSEMYAQKKDKGDAR